MFSADNYVYHVTTPDRAERCVDEGIIPNFTTQCRSSSIETNKVYDAARPGHLVDLGLLRGNSVYAHPDFNGALKKANGGWLIRAQAELAVLSILVPKLGDAHVFDGLLNDEPYGPGDYWASWKTLGDYRSMPKPEYVVPHPSNREYDKTYNYVWPEVLLPGVVPPENIQWDGIVHEPVRGYL